MYLCCTVQYCDTMQCHAVLLLVAALPRHAMRCDAMKYRQLIRNRNILLFISQFAFVRAMNNPPMASLFSCKHCATDELFGSWMFALATFPLVPYCLVREKRTALTVDCTPHMSCFPLYIYMSGPLSHFSSLELQYKPVSIPLIHSNFHSLCYAILYYPILSYAVLCCVSRLLAVPVGAE
jgi:hypothetical protein